MNIKTAIILGTRPEIIKLSPVIREFDYIDSDYFIIHTGQHYSYNMDKLFFKELALPQVKYQLAVGSSSHGEQTAKILIGVEKVLQNEHPSLVLVVGDTNSGLAGALAATKLHIIIGHVEAGLRSYDRQMPEEINRILIDHCSDFLFAPTKNAESTLLKEGISKSNVFVTGNTIVDSINQHIKLANDRHEVLNALGIKSKGYFLVTIHRQENVDNIERLKSILDGLTALKEKYQVPIICPVHPRLRRMIDEFGIYPDNLTMIDPIGFLDFLHLETNARLILTDSGGVQEESCILNVPCVTLRDNTERPETLEVGANALAGSDPDRIIQCTEQMLSRENKWQNPFGDGRAGERIVRIMESI